MKRDILNEIVERNRPALEQKNQDVPFDKLAAIAAAAGFCNASYFSKVFRAVVGQSPRQWRTAQKRLHWTATANRPVPVWQSGAAQA